MAALLKNLQIGKTVIYCVASAGVGILTRIGHLYSGNEPIHLIKLAIPAIVGAAIMFLGIVTDATKPTQGSNQG